MLMGFAGAIYSLDYNPVWSYNFILGWGFIALAFGLLLHVESLHPAGRLLTLWNPLAALAQSAARPARHFFQVHLEDSALCNHGGRSAAHGNQVVQDPVGCRKTRGARTALPQRLNLNLTAGRFELRLAAYHKSFVNFIPEVLIEVFDLGEAQDQPVIPVCVHFYPLQEGVTN